MRPYSKNFADPGRDMVVLANFPRWAPDPSPYRHRCANFENKYFDIDVGRNRACKLVRERGPKNPMRNFYTAIPAMKEFMPLTQRCDVRGFFAGRPARAMSQRWKCFFPTWRS